MTSIAVCGDSNSTTVYGGTNIYAKVIADALGYTLNNYAVGGKRSDEIISQVTSALSAGNDIVIINAGTVDLILGVGSSLQDTMKNIHDSVQSMINSVVSAGKKPVIFAPILVREPQNQYKYLLAEDVLKELCTRKGVDFVPVTSWMAAKALTMTATAYNAWFYAASSNPDENNRHGVAAWHADLAAMFLNRTIGTVTGGGTPPPSGMTIAYKGLHKTPTGSGPFTFAGKDIGTAASDRQVVVFINSEGGSAGLPTSASIGGISIPSSTFGQMATSSPQVHVLTVIFATVPTGSTADIVIGYSVTKNAPIITVYEIHGAATITSTDAFASNVVSGGTISGGSVSVSANGGIIVAGQSDVASPQTGSWSSGFTEDSEDLNTLSGATRIFSTANRVITTATAITPIYTPNSSPFNGGVLGVKVTSL